ncbi:AAA family ATPase [Xanthovirga aplysinae]|uniref:AAA family ATPase n=1 Tax=Xanthovirga aplysinae TaxID=2529853 RepID=UPI0012BC88AA|nr:AAA family ATPase [Xanthovirga aplysinae]MTI32371.1 hypothetical protein [Xanthovirga aplysinae]
MKIIVFGASGSGTTTLSQSLAQKLNWIHLDTDEYYWAKTETPFQTKIPLEIRNENLKKDFESYNSIIVSGSLVSWGEYWNNVFDLGVFLHLPQDIRMERLIKREQKRYGENLITDIQIKTNSNAFLAWAKKYDDESFIGRNIIQHKKWIELLKCECLKIQGDLTNEQRMNIVLEKKTTADTQ